MSKVFEKGFTKIPNEAIPYLSQLTKEEIIFWMYLKMRCHQKSYCWPSYQTMMDDLGFKFKGNVSRRIKSLKVKGWLDVKQSKGHVSNYFPLIPKPDGLDSKSVDDVKGK